MNIEEAEKLINAYGRVISNINPNEGSRKLSSLPCSIGRLRFAFLQYFEFLITDKLLTQKIADDLKGTYRLLNTFISDADSETINSIHLKIRFDKDSVSAKEKELYGKYLNHAFRLDESFELNSFINECLNQRDNQDYILH